MKKVVFSLVSAALFSGFVIHSETQPELMLVMISDASTEAVMEAENNPTQNNAQKNCIEQLNDFLDERGYFNGWDSEKKRMLVIGKAGFDCQDPVDESNFMAKREMTVKEVILMGKSEVINSIETKLTAVDKLQTPGTGIWAELEAEVKETEQQQLMNHPRNI